eukprot:TRINITY_DN9910_c0_g1_i4.p1 TRINITY_DN9910_c0_g1~~TRINITY_DN9910_c0_g1_i4.p1  ORF type:complete len:187 (-),score=18.86 TRINITY_DN9910_c0_g1_i4:292-852(-)
MIAVCCGHEQTLTVESGLLAKSLFRADLRALLESLQVAAGLLIRNVPLDCMQIHEGLSAQGEDRTAQLLDLTREEVRARYGLLAVWQTTGTLNLLGWSEESLELTQTLVATMLQNPAFVWNAPTVAAIRLLDNQRELFAQESGCYIVFDWETMQVLFYGLDQRLRERMSRLEQDAQAFELNPDDRG